MLFSTPLFLYVFFPAFFGAYFLTPRRYRNLTAFTGSLFFYAWGEPRFVFVLLAALLVDFELGKRIATARLDDPTRAKRWLALGVTLNTGLLVYFKYTNFLFQNLLLLLKPFHAAAFDPLSILLPLGVSFFVFEEMTYLVDLYRGVGRPAKNFLHYAVYIMLFPKLLAGPIIKYHDIEGQLEDRNPTRIDVAWGLERFITGLAKKVLIADTVTPLAAQAFSMPHRMLDTGTAWWGLAAFMLQAYFDFSGYSDMAVGMARMMGFHLRENFNEPYLSTSFTDFWHRWHISLSTWIRNYLYFPLGGNRVSPGRTYLNLAICFLLCGLWHGANWTFVVWGLYNGVFLIADKLFWLQASRWLPTLVNQALTFLLVSLGFVFIPSDSASTAFNYLSRLLGLTEPDLIGQARVFIPSHGDQWTMALGALWVTFPLLTGALNRPRPEILPSQPFGPWRSFGLLALLLLSLIKISSSSFNPFIYFRF